jgi:hypothetical protein
MREFLLVSYSYTYNLFMDVGTVKEISSSHVNLCRIRQIARFKAGDFLRLSGTNTQMRRNSANRIRPQNEA